MKIGGFIKNSLIDYPEKIAAVIFTQGCNFKCPYCHNPELVPFEGIEEFDGNEILSFLEKRKLFLDAVVITGGEPTLQKNLVDFLTKIKRTGLLIKLDTNGSRPEILKKLLDKNLIDLVAMDIKAPISEYGPFTNEKEIEEKLSLSIDIVKSTGVDCIFRTTCVHPFVNHENIENIVSCIEGAEKYNLQKFKIEKILNPDFFSSVYEYSQEDLEIFKKTALSYVKECKII